MTWTSRFKTTACGIVAISSLFAPSTSFAEYGDVVINNHSDKAGVNPPVFPHWFHRVRFACRTCHTDLGFAMKAGGNGIDMASISSGAFCGACHDGSLAWSAENCHLCHTGKPGSKSGVHRPPSTAATTREAK